ncbi:hypothetical protein Q8A67_009615 [Cirrhinus molitorella]|uniref:Alkyl hydroperoxide reductase subunit C/ Thiol specific antioxidant domain-containing protein n=1 Tax=Cirrhinus molitorella TaxID=172907 RepID=A0AA88Q0Y5_9TELE|nr:hypothetical protein Q8A67_009615 [Cirrhinus molitorella]
MSDTLESTLYDDSTDKDKQQGLNFSTPPMLQFTSQKIQQHCQVLPQTKIRPCIRVTEKPVQHWHIQKQLKETQKTFQQRIQQREKDVQQLRETVESHKVVTSCRIQTHLKPRNDSYSINECFSISWGVLFSHPRDFTPVCTTELGRAAQLSLEFRKRNVKLIVLSVDGLEEHHDWSKDIMAYNNAEPGSEFPFPIIADDRRELVEELGMLDPEEKDQSGMIVRLH